jgi:hypothetical protein
MAELDDKRGHAVGAGLGFRHRGIAERRHDHDLRLIKSSRSIHI